MSDYYRRRGWVNPIGTGLYTEHTTTGVTVSKPLVKWEWHLGNSMPVVDVSNTITVDRQEHIIRYPETALPGARYKLVVHPLPHLPPEQGEAIAKEKANLVEVWKVEKEVQDNLLTLWAPPREWLSDGYQGCAIRTVAQDNGDRYIEYSNTISVRSYPTIEISITVRYDNRSSAGVAWAELSLVHGDRPIHLDTINLPIVDGVASNVPLVEYLTDNPLMKAGRALSKLGTAINTPINQ